MTATSTSIFEFESPPLDATKDGLFIERLDAFLQKSLGDIKAFAERELRPYEETRRRIAEWHAQYLFQSPPPLVGSGKNPLQVRSILCDTSHILESLSAISGVQSFILAIDSEDPSDNGFLGGSMIGREFWRGLRGGGEPGARAFKAQCATHLQNTESTTGSPHSRKVERHVSTPPAKSIKSELYESVRNTLRLASGVRSAEMKWTNPERLDVYGVRLVGWPEGIPYQNPSTLKVNQNKTLLEAIQHGSMKFVKIIPDHASGSRDTLQDGDGINEDFSWAYDADALPASPAPTTASSSSILTRAPTVTPLPSIDNNNPSWSLDPTMAAEASDAAPLAYDANYSWEGELNEEILNPGEDWSEESNSILERPKKRQRSDELYSGVSVSDDSRHLQ